MTQNQAFEEARAYMLFRLYQGWGIRRIARECSIELPKDGRGWTEGFLIGRLSGWLLEK